MIAPTQRTEIVFDLYRRIKTGGLLTSIIDCSLSRFTDPTKRTVYYRNLEEDPWLFEGDAKVKQYNVYREMAKQTGRKWQDHHPQTNVLWLKHLVDYLVCDKLGGKVGRGKKKADAQLTGLLARLDHYSTIKQLMTEDEFFQ